MHGVGFIKTNPVHPTILMQGASYSFLEGILW